MTMRPVFFRWKKVSVVAEGGQVIDAFVMVPHKRFMPLATRQFVDGEDYPLIPLEPRDMKSHNHFFAQVSDIWKNLPETEKRFPTSEHLRHWALIQEGYRTEIDFAFPSARAAKTEAMKLRLIDPYAVILVEGSIVKVLRARSQSRDFMKNAEFKESKKAVLARCSAMIGVTPRDVSRHSASKVPPEKQQQGASR